MTMNSRGIVMLLRLALLIALLAVDSRATAQDDDLLGLDGDEGDTSDEVLGDLSADGEADSTDEVADSVAAEDTPPASTEDDVTDTKQPQEAVQQSASPDETLTTTQSDAPEAEPIARIEEKTQNANTPRAVRLRLGAGLGYGSLGYKRPIAVGDEILPDTPFAAAGVMLALHAFPASMLSVEVQAAYQTSVGMTLEINPLFALPERVSTRFQYLEAGVAPVLRLGSSLDAPALAWVLGFSVRTFAPIPRQYSIERFQLGGPHTRLELRFPLGDLVSVRVGPQLQWVLLINSGLSDQGACCNGLSLGGQGLVEANVGSVLRAQLAYREAHTYLPFPTYAFRSVERFLMAFIAGEL